MTHIKEHGFSIDLPGEWVPGESDEPGAFIYSEVGGSDVVKVMLLAVKPLFAIADKNRLLSDYVTHRSTYESSLFPTLVHFEAFFEERDDELEAWWPGEDSVSGYRQQHRALLLGETLVDACYGSEEPEQAVFESRAEQILSTLEVAE